MLRGEYVILRVPELDDADIITSWHNDREVTKYLAENIYSVSKTALQGLIKQIYSEKNAKHFLIETEDEIPIGLGSLNDIDWINGTAEIRVVLYAKNCWGRGYGYDCVKTLTEYAMYELNLNTIYVKLIEENERAIKCFQKAGYEAEGKLMKRVIKENKYKNIISMSIYKKGNNE
ncbi:spermidine N(1)-acetyltransferase [Oxobacter pfennigii]|uniref:Spermidine N(1)-acetyltransferase n=1 Tax=Oxobacter pfennigii TaxID=36849 RepID=A0A0P8WF16_9CLOT|nr:GNAT family N-acetyltransferase [Oxobacter pfennigii]KPU46381.1 spermidine N(1)-acetyltransferase [Oxobacter pfennigii]